MGVDRVLLLLATSSLLALLFAGRASAASPLQLAGSHSGKFFCVYHPTNGQAVCWGDNDKHQLGFDTEGNDKGLNERADELPVINLLSAAGQEDKSFELALGSIQACSLFSDDRLFCWGGNGWSELGWPQSTPIPIGNSSFLTDVEDGEVRLGFVKMGTQWTCSVVAPENTGVRCWGRVWGQLATPPIRDWEQSEIDFEERPAEGKVRQLLVGGVHACLLYESNQTFCWGKNYISQAGQDNNFQDVGVSGAQALDFGGGLTTRKLFAGRHHTCALLSDDSTRCWGSGAYGQLGNNDLLDRGNIARPVSTTGALVFPGHEGQLVKDLCGGEKHTCALLEDASVWCWGAGMQAGNGTTEALLTPHLLEFGINEDVQAQQIACSTSATCVLFNNSTVRCWGDGEQGQLGAGVSGNQNTAANSAVLYFAHLLVVPEEHSSSSSASSFASSSSFSASSSSSSEEEETRLVPVPLAVTYPPNKPQYAITADEFSSSLPQEDVEPLQLGAEFALFESEDSILSLPEEWNEGATKVEEDGTVRHEVSLSLPNSNSTLVITHLDIKSPGVRETLPGSGRTFEVGPSVKTTLTVYGWPFYPTPPTNSWTWTMSLELPSSQRLFEFECKSIGDTVEECLAASMSKGWTVRLKVVLEALADDKQVAITYDILSRSNSSIEAETDIIDVKFHLPPFEHSLFFDPDLSVLLRSEEQGDGEDETKEGDEGEGLLLVYVLVPVFVVVLMVAVVVGGTLWIRRKRALNKARVNKRLSGLATAL
ncbi:Alpha-tubulin suppressor [Balamuthia mandrillaris]